MRSTQSKVFPVRWASSDFRAAAVLAGHCLQPYGFTDALGRVPLEEPPGCLRSSGTRTSYLAVRRLGALRSVAAAGDAYLA